MAASGRTSTGWFAVARAAEVGTRPVPVGAGGRAYVVVRLRTGGEVSAFPARCPHRLVPLAAARVVEGRLECPYHGWRFDDEGRCVTVPSLGPDGSPPPRADLSMPWAVEERHGWIWLAPERTPVPLPRPAGMPALEPVPGPPGPAGPVLGNLDPSLEHAWHPLALSRELRPGGWLQVRLLGRTWMLRRGAGGLAADPPAFGVRERLGVVWLAPAQPYDSPLEVPEDGDRRFVSTWLPPVRSPGPAGPLADTFLDVGHAPFVHSRIGGPPDAAEIPAFAVSSEDGGFRAELERAYETPHHPGGVDGPPVRRRATYTYRVPFQLRLRLDSPDSGAVTTVLCLLQPEDADSTRVYTRMLMSAGPGERLPGPEELAREVAIQRQVLAEDLDLQARLPQCGLPLGTRDEVHVPADRPGVALRRALCDFAAATARLAA
ncbi:aromatic ring-hydroxylating dioxygenase subunit alpha [Geodermatophilus sabuli]|uniref:Aromatic ring-hydroxylating dioxygenase subunit alpha n=1 Tax=Geodermatophilus sabuli TaxID=1564158 RepID=A0A7K3W295_9ACTN|nr:Rieske 2Fe-2S domain-containing protein [Geodermatophilus sabuli]NEK58912.1 aromatic ring-hydroxylating dioxygenase subunit alpha [Geodermatophilus sabuli]